MAMNPFHTQHRQNLERVTRSPVATAPSGKASAVLGEEIDVQISERAGVRRSVESRRRLWVHPVLVGTAVLQGKELVMPDLDCYAAVWIDVAFRVNSNAGVQYNTGDLVMQARWECVPVEGFDLSNGIIVPNGADIITDAGDFARYRASFGVVVAETSTITGSDYRFVSRQTGEPVDDVFLPYYFQMLIPNFSATPPLALF